MCLCERDTECECVKNRTKHTDCSRGQELWMLAVVIHSLLLSLWIVWMSCYLLHDAPGSTCSNQICLLLPVRRRENPEEIPSSIGCLKHHGGGSTAMYVRSLWHRLHIHDCSLLCVCRNLIVCVVRSQNRNTNFFNGSKKKTKNRWLAEYHQKSGLCVVISTCHHVDHSSRTSRRRAVTSYHRFMLNVVITTKNWLLGAQWHRYTEKMPVCQP